jgi:hypothetical protein
MLAMSAAKTEPHLSVPCWVLHLHCLTMSTMSYYLIIVPTA